MATITIYDMRIFIIILILTTFSIRANDSIKDNCHLLKKIFTHQKVINLLHPELQSRKILYLVENDFCNDQAISTGKIKILTIKKSDIGICHKKNVIWITIVKRNEKELILSLKYPIEGAYFKISIDKQGNLTNVDVIEI